MAESWTGRVQFQGQHVPYNGLTQRTFYNLWESITSSGNQLRKAKRGARTRCIWNFLLQVPRSNNRRDGNHTIKQSTIRLDIHGPHYWYQDLDVIRVRYLIIT
jgi:hypothetical protein